MSSERTTIRRRIWRFLRLAVIAIALPVLLVPTLIGGFGMWALTHAPCSYSEATPNDYKLSYLDLSIPARNGKTHRGFYIPGAVESFRNGATIIFPPAYAQDRTGMFYEAIPIAQAGYNVVLYDSRTCVGLALSLGYRDAEDLADVLAILRARDNQLVSDRLALHGFSSAGAASIMAAADDAQFKAVVAEGGYHRLDEYLGIGSGGSPLDLLFQFGMQVAYRLSTGDDSSVLDPIGVIAQIPPRPIFLIYGTNEASLGGARRKMAEIQAAAPDAMARLWEVPGAGHGTYIRTVGEPEYTSRVLAFYDCALFERCAAWDALWQ